MGGRSNTGGRNNSSVSQRISTFVEQVMSQIESQGLAQVVINETKSSTVTGSAKAENPAMKDVEKELLDWGNKNGLSVSFQTKTTSSNHRERKLKQGYRHSSEQRKQRIMYVYTRQGE